MISRGQREVAKRKRGRRCCTHVSLSEFDGQSMAVILPSGGKRIVLRGTAYYVRDTAAGNSLHIQLDENEPGRPVLIFSEDEGRGRIIPDFHYGCDFCLVLDEQ